MRAYFRGFDDFSRKLNRFSETLPDVLDRVIGQYAEMIRREAVENLDRNKTNNTGDLRKSITTERLKPMKWRVLVGEKYGIFVERGTRPHFPPPSEIEKWAVRKLKLRGREARRAAWAIAKTIAKRGTKAQPFFKPAVEKILPRLKRALIDAIKDLIMRL